MDTQKNNNKEEINLSGIIRSAPDGFDDGAKPQNKKQTLNQIFNPEMPRMVRWVIKYSGGIIKNEKQASYILLILIVIMFVVSLFLFYSQMIPQKVKPMPPELVNEIEQMYNLK